MKKLPLLRVIASVSAFLMLPLSLSSFKAFALDAQPVLSLTQLSQNFDDFDEDGNGVLSKFERTVTISLDVNGADHLWSTLNLHIALDKRLSIAMIAENEPDTTVGPAQDSNIHVETFDSTNNTLIITSAGTPLINSTTKKLITAPDGTPLFTGSDGTIVSFDVILPEDAKPGDKFNVAFNFVQSYDMFTNTLVKAEADSDSLAIDPMTRYAIDHWVNGFVQINPEPVVTTTTTSTSTTSTTIPTTTSTSTSSTTIPTTTSTSISSTTSTTAWGDIDNNGVVNSVDASLALTEYASTSTGRASSLSALQKLIADVNNDTIINSIDASLIITFYAKSSSNS